MIIPPNYEKLLANLRLFNTKQDLYKSDFYAQHSKELDAIVNHIWQKPFTNAKPRLENFLRITHWNIERGKHLDTIVELFNSHPILKASDIISLNEVDLGMSRSKNLNIAFELGQRLGMHAAYVAEFIELTKGIGQELAVAGDNQESLHGNAILSRYPIRSVKAVRLPSCFDTYQFSEKRYGERVALIAEIEVKNQVIWLVNTHLEVRYIPLCRAAQFSTILDTLETLPTTNNPIIIAGDLNVGTFKRGSVFYSFTSFLRLAFNNPARVAEQLRHPAKYEPLFSIAKSKGFDYEAYNDDSTTCATSISGVDEAKKVPNWLQKRIDKRLAPYNNRLEFRLDYFFARKIKSLKLGELTDQQTLSTNPITIPGLLKDGEQISDHDPIVCDFAISPTDCLLG